MPRSQPDSLITALGFTQSQERLYVRLLPQSGRELVSVAEALMTEPDALTLEMAAFVDRGLVRVDSLTRVFVATPPEALATVLSETAAEAARTEARLRLVAGALPFMTTATARPRAGEVYDVEHLDGEISSGGNVGALLTALIMQSKGDLLQLRPDQWRSATDDPMVSVLREVIGSGRRLRSIYPLRALQAAPDALTSRAAIGEEIRLLPEVPTRMLVLGRTHAILPEPLGFADEPRSLIRQRGLVDALTLWFEELWEHAAPLPDLDGVSTTPDLRRFLLQQLATGAQDEQIARRLGISLRTVRRRIAEVLVELGAESRFQAGVEAVRRGWL
jgi:DNA-binding CsgD family transcriptional regulator